MILTIFLVGCSEPSVEFYPDTSWYTRVSFSEKTKKWLKDNAPSFVWVDLEVVAKNNDKFEALKPKREVE